MKLNGNEKSVKEIIALEKEVEQLKIQKENTTTDAKERKLQKTIKKLNKRINKLRIFEKSREEAYEAELEYRQLRGK